MEKVQFKCLKPDDLQQFQALLSIFKQELEPQVREPVSDTHLLSQLALPEFYVLVAVQEAEVIGGMTVYALHQYHSQRPQAYLYDLAVTAPKQGKGVGKQLMRYARAHFADLGFESLYVQADAIDHDAVAFYQATQPTEADSVLHFTYALTL